MRCLVASLVVATFVAVVDAARPAHPILDACNVNAPNSRAPDSRPDSPPSLPAIFTNLISETRPYADQLAFLTPESARQSIISNAVTSMDAAFAAVLPRVQALVGQNASTVFASVDGEATWTLPEFAAIIGRYFSLISAANVWTDQDRSETLLASTPRHTTARGRPNILRPIGQLAQVPVVDLRSAILASS